jgi:hypothetical protein
LLSRFRTLALSHSLVFLAAAPAFAAGTASLRGSPAAMERHHEVAQALHYSFLRNRAEVEKLAEAGGLVEIVGNADFEVARGVSFPFARPEVRIFVERFAAQYREGCGETLVVTSLTRPLSGQPRNAHPLSVHPAGMAIDFRVPRVAACRTWLEQSLLALEQRELLDVTRERTPPHYHVAIFPAAYLAYVATLEKAEAAARPPPPAIEEEASAREPAMHGWDSDGLARFALVVALSVAVIFSLARQDASRRDVGF